MLEKQVKNLSLDLEKANQELMLEIAARKHAEEEIRLRSARVEALANIAAKLNVGLDRDKILTTICKEITLSLAVPACGIIIFEEKHARYHLAGGYGLSKDETKWFNQTALLKLIDYQQKNSELIPFQDVQSSPKMSEYEVYNDRNIRPFASVTLNQDSDVIGAMYIFTADENRHFSEEEQAFLRTLANQVIATITNARLFEQVHSGRERLKKLSQQLITVQEAERRFIAKELHDEIGQTLTSLKLSLELISKDNHTDKDQSYFDQAQNLVFKLLQRVRQMSLDLRPGMLDDLGLLPALLYLFERYNAQTNIHINFVQSNIERRFDQEIETTAYRIIQEALTNVARHASVNQVFVRIWADEKILGLQVEDEGIGFNLEADMQNKHRFGLSGMKERAILIGGNLEIESALGEGTRITAELPISGKLERRIDERFDPFS
jgi:signal transduction histidine kinase